MLVGPKRGGKGVVGRVLRATIGAENVCGPTLASLATNFGLAPLLGKSLAVISDARLSGRTDSAIVVERLLSISGEDALTIDRKFAESVTCKLPTRLMLLSNELPRLGDSSGALASRMVLLRLTESFYGREDHQLTDRLLTELPSILLWAIAGWQRLQARSRFMQPAAGDELRGELEDLSSPVGAFVRDCCNVGPECEVSRAALYEAYCDWADNNGKKQADDAATFGRNLRAAFPAVSDRQHRVDGEVTRFYAGVGLKGW
jgi:putative DNA primase/helicase